MQKIKTVDLN